MAKEAPSKLAILLAVAAVAALAFALTATWFTFETSSGRKTAPGGFNDPANTQVERHTLAYTPAGWTGDAQPTHPDDARAALQHVTWALWAGILMLGLAALTEIPPLIRWMPRPVSLMLLGLAPVAIGYALYVGWFQLPATMDGYGVKGPFTSFLSDTGYTRTSLQAGWAVCAAAMPLAIGALMMKFQAGSDELFVPGTTGT